jgi:hypothetical protein
MQLTQVKVIVCVLMFTVLGCSKRYWFRTKIDLPRSNKYSVKINIVNLSPDQLSKEFVEGMHTAASKALAKKGYYEVPIKSPVYTYTLVVKIDSFNRTRRYYDNKKSGSILTGEYPYKYGIAAIVFHSKLAHNGQFGVKWEKRYDIYYLDEKRDISRSKGVVKFLIRTAED